MEVLAIQLLLAHLLTDYFFQPTKWVKDKNENKHTSKFFWLHIGVSFVIPLVLLIGEWFQWRAALLIAITHGIIDYWKIKQEAKLTEKQTRKKRNLFLIDQLLHIGVLLIVWVIFQFSYAHFLLWLKEAVLIDRNLFIVTAILALLSPTGILIGKVTDPFRNKIQKDNSLKNAGKYIGYSERLLVLLFIMLCQYEAIGFLLASKSILRISKDNDDEGRKKTEYVLIGTLLSFFIAIVVGLACRSLLNN
ncbi:MAG: hypothetical protein RL311_1364 [Bacteroidota bacterium]|jgi:hypothetical protein